MDKVLHALFPRNRPVEKPRFSNVDGHRIQRCRALSTACQENIGDRFLSHREPIEASRDFLTTARLSAVPRRRWMRRGVQGQGNSRSAARKKKPGRAAITFSVPPSWPTLPTCWVGFILTDRAGGTTGWRAGHREGSGSISAKRWQPRDSQPSSGCVAAGCCRSPSAARNWGTAPLLPAIRYWRLQTASHKPGKSSGVLVGHAGETAPGSARRGLAAIRNQRRSHS